MIRLNDKVRRLQANLRHDVNDSLKDDLMDIVVYALIGYVLFEEQERGSSSSHHLVQPASAIGS